MLRPKKPFESKVCVALIMSDRDSWVCEMVYKSQLAHRDSKVMILFLGGCDVEGLEVLNLHRAPCVKYHAGQAQPPQWMQQQVKLAPSTTITHAGI